MLDREGDEPLGMPWTTCWFDLQHRPLPLFWLRKRPSGIDPKAWVQAYYDRVPVEVREHDLVGCARAISRLRES